MATLSEILVYYDGPQLVLFRQGQMNLLGVATNALVEGEFFCVSARKNELLKYFRGRADLRYIFRYGRGAQYFVAKPSRNNSYRLEAFNQPPSDDMLPATGFFVEHHTSDYNFASSATDRERLLLDGSWELQDFGKFQQMYAEVYGFFGTLDQLAEQKLQGNKLNKVLSLFAQTPYKGGGSYLGAFRGFADSLPDDAAVGLVSIKKQSPGDMVLAGHSQYFEKVENVVDDFLADPTAVRDAYKELYSYLQAAKLLRMDVSQYVSEWDKVHGDAIKALTESLLAEHELDIGDRLYSACGENRLAFAKIAMGLHRRIGTVSAFFAQGRVRFQ